MGLTQSTPYILSPYLSRYATQKLLHTASVFAFKFITIHTTKSVVNELHATTCIIAYTHTAQHLQLQRAIHFTFDRLYTGVLEAL